MVRNPSRVVTIQPRFRYSSGGHIIVLVCHMILQDHVIKGPSNIMGRSPIGLVTILSSLVAIDIVVVE